MRKFEQVSYATNGTIPTRADSGSAGYDFYAAEDVIINPGETVIVKTNIKAQMDIDDVLMLYVRSSIGIKRCIVLANGTGVIDSSYYNNPDNEGNIMCALYNYGIQSQLINAGDRIAQGVFVKYSITDEDDTVNDTVNKKRTGGIGSTGA